MADRFEKDAEGLPERILEANRALHAAEAGLYAQLHPEEYNWFEQSRIRRDLRTVRDSLRGGGRRALDVGCGTGNISLKLLEMGFEVNGVDISPEMIREVSAAAGGRGSFTAADIDSFVAGCAARFDVVTVSSVLHHLPDYPATLSGLCGLLNPGGLLYVTHEPAVGALAADPFPRKVLWQADNLAFILVKLGRVKRLSGVSYRLSDYQLYHGFDEGKVLRAVTECGLETLVFERYASMMRLGVSCWMDTCLLRSKRQFSLIARKKG